MKKIFPIAIVLFISQLCFSIPKYDEGRLMVKGVQLLQDNEDNSAYYYIPRFPRMATKEDGSYEFMFIKYVGKGSAGANGGLFHALVEFTLPGDEIQRLQDTLREVTKNASAKIVGPVSLQQVMKDGEQGMASFQVVSSILSNATGNNSFTQSIITSGHAPFLPGSKAAIAARLNQDGATLLWESLQGKTSDVSIVLNGYYEAYVKAFNASITAEVNSIYEHYSKLTSVQEGFQKDQLRKITDELVQNQVLKIESFDRSATLGVKADDMKALLNLVTDKLIELLFDSKSGWSKIPDREVAVEPDQIKGRQERGWWSQTFGGAENTPYFSDNQFVLKRRKDVRSNKFYLNLTQATTVKVPIYTSGNLAGVYDAMKRNGEASKEYFKIVNLDDIDFQKRDISFMMDGAFAESFNDIFNAVTVSFRKKYIDQPDDVTSDILFTRKNIESSSAVQNISYPRLGTSSSNEWLQYEYKVNWNLKGSTNVIKDPPGEEQWNKASDGAVILIPPIKRKKITLEIDRSAFVDSTATSTVVVKFMVVLGGKPTLQKTMILRASDPSNRYDLSLFHDPEEAVAYQVTRYTPTGEIRGKIKELKDDFLLIGSKN